MTANNANSRYLDQIRLIRDYSEKGTTKKIFNNYFNLLSYTVSADKTTGR